MRLLTTVAFGLVAVNGLRAGDPADAPRPIPLTRPTMKELIEDMKSRTPRIPLPPLTDEEKAKLGERGGGYEGRLRALYMAPGDGGRGALGFSGGRDSDPNLSLDSKFKT